MKKVLITGVVIAVLLFATFVYALPAAPDVAVFAKYPTDGSVDLYTGDMNLNIPLMTVPGRGGMDFPISLGYSAGIKVNQQPSWVGLGWSLGVGSVSRSVNGIPDDYNTDDPNENIYSYNKFTSSVSYYDKEQRVDWYQTLWSMAFTVATVGGNVYAEKAYAAEIAKGNMNAQYKGQSPSFSSPTYYMDYDLEQVSIPSEGSKRDVDGFVKIYNYHFVDGSPVGFEGFHDINFPDTFFLSSPLFSGQLIYGDPTSETGSKIQFHLKRAGGNLIDREEYAISGCLGDDNTKNNCGDAVHIKFEKEGNLINQFTITNVDGSQYIFTPTVKTALSPTQNKPASAVKSPTTNWVSFTQNTIFPYSDGGCHFNEDFNYNEIYLLKEYYTEWGLKEIRDPNFVNYDKGNWVKIHYDDSWSAKYHDSNPRQETIYDCMEGPDGTMSYGESWLQFKTIKSIETPTHVAMFYTENRQDGKDLDGNARPLLRKIALYDKNTCTPSTCTVNSEALVTYYFNYDYSLAQGTPDNPTGAGKLTLKAVTQCGKGPAANCPASLEKTPPYIFEYGDNPNFNLKKFDMWGYYQPYADTLDHGTIYDPGQGYADAWSLRKVTWPSGGTTEWLYETDRFSKVGTWVPMPGVSSSDHDGGGIRVTEIKNCDKPLLGSCTSTKYLYTKNDLDFSEASSGDTSGVENVLPGTYGDTQTNLIDGAAFSNPVVGYSKVTVVSGYNSASSSDTGKAPYGYSVYEFTTAEDFPNEGTWKPRILFHSPVSGQDNKIYGFDFRRTPTSIMTLPIQKPIIVVGPIGHTLRFVFGKWFGMGGTPIDYCISDVTIDEDLCNIGDGISGCKNVKFDRCIWEGFTSTEGADELYGYDCGLEGGTPGEWCPVMIDWTDWPQFTPPSVASSAPMFFFRSTKAYHVTGGNPDGDYYNFDDPEAWSYPEGACIDNNENNVCDRIEMSLPVEQRYGGTVDKSDFHGFNTEIRTYNINNQATPVKRVVNSYNFAEPKDKIDPSYHFPKAYWLPLNGVQTTLDGHTTTSSYVYNPVNGLPQEVYEQGNNEIRITKTTWAGFDHLTGMVSQHKWSQVYESSTYEDSTDLFNRKSYARTEWAPGTSFTYGSDSAYFPHYVYSGTGGSDGEEVLLKEFVDYDQYGGNLLSEKNYINDNNYMLTKYYYGDNSNPCSQSPLVFSHAYVTCAQQCKDASCSQKLTTTYKYGSGQAIQMGQISEIKDLDNNDVMTYIYDNMWRLQKTIAPYDSVASPTKSYSYYYAMADYIFNLDEGNYVETIQRQQADGSNLLKTIAYADGLSRNKESAIDAGNGQTIRQNTVYEDLSGLPVKTTKTYIDSQTQWGKTHSGMSPPSGMIYTETKYYSDPLARVYLAYPYGEYPGGANVEYDYGGDSEHKWTSVKDENGIWSASSVDKLGNVRDAVVADTEGNPDKSRTIFTTNILGNILTTKVDPLDGQPESGDNSKVITTTNVYDTRGRLRVTQSPDSGVDRNLVIDRQGKVLLAGRECDYSENYENPETLSGANTYGCDVLIAYEYDSLGRLSKVNYDFDSDYEIQYFYDAATADCAGTNLAGRLVQITDEAGKTCLSYDDRGRIQQKKNYVGGTWYTTSYTYDSSDKVKTITYPSSHSVEYFYNKVGQLEGIEIDEEQVSFLYNPTGTIDQITFPNGITTAFDYTNRDWISTQTISGSGVNWQRAYQYDNTGNLVNEYSDTALSTKIGNYQYDYQNRLKNVNDYNNYYGTNIAYTYDRVGNRESENIFNTLRDYTYIPNTNKLQFDGTYTYGYDSRGNIISKSGAGTTTAYTYNTANQLTGVTDGNYCENYVYNADGMRTIKNSSFDTNLDWNELETTQIKIANVTTILSNLGISNCVPGQSTCVVGKIETDSKGNVYFNAGDMTLASAPGYLIKCDESLNKCVNVALLSSPLATFAIDKTNSDYIYASSGTKVIRLKRSGFWYSYNSVQETVDVGSNVRGIFTTNDGFYVLHDMGVKKYSLTLGLLSQSSSGLNSAIQGQGPRAIAVSENDVFISLITGNKIIKTDTGLTGVNATYTDTTQPSHVDVDAEGYPYVVDKITDGSRLFKLDKGLTTKLNVFEQYNGACSDVADFSVTVGKGSVYVTNIYCPYVTSIPTGTQTLYIYDGLNPIYEKTKIINATCLSYNNSCGTVQSGDCNNQGSGYCFFGEIVMNCVKCGGCSGEFRCQTNKNMTNYGSCYRPAAKPGKPVQVVEQNPPVV